MTYSQMIMDKIINKSIRLKELSLDTINNDFKGYTTLSTSEYED